ncbi:rab proteins geranylgeranyltransferase component A 1-like protein [Leptotrombidium deliense]|uniref:Rab proteins geranylgeranyltransferase component A 1-like protein n=1 Tax=Leptotrombidium deliense TaxID=299467 RepID=A0A443SIB3_9ACAR|nr:rab proteins geranylgeranyltransferase component A 1-like protein [Leptotrombidium deliense]
MELDSSFDVVVVGTGLTESVIAAAVARIGRTVLHLDCTDYYGGDWTSFSFSRLVEWATKQRAPHNETPQTSGNSGDGCEVIVDCNHKLSTILNVEVIDYTVKEESEEACELESAEKSESDIFTFQKLIENDRKFNIDLCPRLLFSRGAMVDTLVHSNISRYLEFKAVTRILTYATDQSGLLDVPCSRCDIFTNKTISVIEKRMLMRFITECMQQNQILTDLEAYKNRPFVEFLESKGLSVALQGFIINAIAMCDASETTEKAMVAVNQFLSSLGRFGNTPFIFPLYGSGELPQAFCRFVY